MAEEGGESAQGIRGYLTGRNGVQWGLKEFTIIALVTAVVGITVIALVLVL